MFCRQCGQQIADGLQECPYCGETYGSGIKRLAKSGRIRLYVLKAMMLVASVALACIGLVVGQRLIDTLEMTIRQFSSYDQIAAGVGIAAYVGCGLLLVLLSAAAVVPLVRVVLDTSESHVRLLSRSVAFTVVFLVLLIAVWVCKLVFFSTSGGDVAAILHSLFASYGEIAARSIAPAIAALALQLVARYKLMAAG